MGSNMYSVTCHRSQDDCWEEASRVCPTGFALVDRTNPSSITYVQGSAGFQMASTMPTGDGSMLIECKQDPNAIQLP